MNNISLLKIAVDKEAIIMSHSLKNKVFFITGATRGIGRAMALRLAKAGARVVITGKTTQHEQAPYGGSIHSVAKEIEALDGDALPLELDVRDAQTIDETIQIAAQHWERLDGVICNAGALDMSPALQTPMKRFDLVHQVNVRATFAAIQSAAPYLEQSPNPHVIVMAPPINLNPHWFKQGTAYTISKYGMSLCVLGFAQELAETPVALHGLWPKTLIATAAIKKHFPSLYPMCRQPEIVADAAYYLLSQDSSKSSGDFLTDEAILQDYGINDFDQYAIDASQTPYPDFYIDH